jgi:hypothetical protein
MTEKEAKSPDKRGEAERDPGIEKMNEARLPDAKPSGSFGQDAEPAARPVIRGSHEPAGAAFGEVCKRVRRFGPTSRIT